MEWPERMSAGPPVSCLSNDQWMDIIQYLAADEFKSLRLAGSKTACLSDPRLTSHLRLRVDKVPFFRDGEATCSQEHLVRRWLDGRERLAIDDASASISPSRTAELVAGGFLDSVCEVVVRDCHRHRTVLEALSHLPNVRILTLVERGGGKDDDDHGKIAEELEAAVRAVGNIQSLTTLDIEFDVVVHGSRLSFLGGLRNLRRLRLEGFDLSEGISFIGRLSMLETLHLCHGNFFSSPGEDVNEKDLTDLVGLANLTRVHLEGFDCLTGVGMSPFARLNGSVRDLILKHCQEASDECLVPIGRMNDLQSLHFILSSCDDTDVFDREELRRLNALPELKRLSLFYVLCDPTDLGELPGLTSLETLNVAFEESMTEKEAENLFATAMQVFPSLRKLRIFSEDDCMECCFRYGGLDVEYATFNFGDVVYLE